MARPRGYAVWKPQAATARVVDQVGEVLDEYRDHLPLTVRQIFYRLVGQYGFEKTEKAYQRLIEYVVRARRARMIPFSSIRDDGTTALGGGGYDSAEDFWQGVAYSAGKFKRDRMAGQPVSIELWCEAAGMAPQLARVARPFSIPVYSTGGFSSVTVTKEIADRALDAGRPTLFLHVGDFDPSGQSIYESMAADAQAFVFQERTSALTADLRPSRVALTEAQVEEYDLPTAPPKSSDSRSVNWLTETCQAEAMPPDLLADVVRRAIEDQVDEDLREVVLEAEREDRAAIAEVLRGTDLSDDALHWLDDEEA